MYVHLALLAVANFAHLTIRYVQNVMENISIIINVTLLVD